MSKIIVALDFSSAIAAKDLALKLDPSLCKLKVGKQLFTACGPQVVKDLVQMGYDVFLDLKFHDIPNTVALAVQEAAKLGVWMVNVHAAGGLKMMQQARQALQQLPQAPLLIAVTLLTSMDKRDLQQLKDSRAAHEVTRQLAALAKQAQLDGVVCSAQDAPLIKQHFGSSWQIVSPGIRPKGYAADDQQRIMTPSQAVANGSDYLVIGRPITANAKPRCALESILAALASQ